MPKPEQNPDTVIATAMRIEGELKSNGNINVDGIVSGKIHTTQNLHVGVNAQIDADLIANNAVIAGVVKGNITAKNTISITQTGRVLGNISCAGLDIQTGALFIGNCRMQESQSREIVEVEETVEE